MADHKGAKAQTAKAQPAKEGILDKVQGALGKLQAATGRLMPQQTPPPTPPKAERPETPPPAAAPAVAPTQRAQPTGRLMESDSARLTGRSAPLPVAASRGTSRLPGSAEAGAPASGTAPLPVLPPSPKTAEEVQRSLQRLKFIAAYAENPAADPLFNNKAFVYKVLSDERAHQQDLILIAADGLAKLPETGNEALVARRRSLEAEIDVGQRRQAQLFTMTKRLMGIRGKTGGTGFNFKLKSDPSAEGKGGKS